MMPTTIKSETCAGPSSRFGNGNKNGRLERMVEMATHFIDGAEVSDEELALARRYPMVVYWSAEDGAYVATFPGLQGIGISGKTAAEAARKGEEIIVNYVTALLDAGRELPEPIALAAIA
jgi:predicted RNase H-like HicB family nuclease